MLIESLETTLIRFGGPPVHFILFAFSMILLGIGFSYIFSLFVGPLVIVVSKTENKVAIGFFVVVAIFIQAFLVLFWDAYTLTRSVYYSQTHTWLYVGFGFFAAIGPLGYMASKENPQESNIGSCIYLLLAMVGYWVFYFFPVVMFALYGWFLNWWFR